MDVLYNINKIRHYDLTFDNVFSKKVNKVKSDYKLINYYKKTKDMYTCFQSGCVDTGNGSIILGKKISREFSTNLGTCDCCGAKLIATNNSLCNRCYKNFYEKDCLDDIKAKHNVDLSRFTK